MKRYLLIIMLLAMPYNSFAQIQVSNLVIPVNYFVNHIKQLTFVKSNLVKYRQASLVGISGMGKTQLARMYAYENKNNYNVIWFIDCNLDINEEFLKLAKSINAVSKSNLISEDVLSAKKEVMSYLSSKDKWLLVFDNLKIKENEKVQEFVNWEHNGHILFGSQDSELLPNIVKMTAFEKSDAITLANNILEKENNDVKLSEFLAQEFAGYPILIVQGAQLLKQIPGLDKKEYKKGLGKSTDKIKLNITLAIKELKPNARELLNKIALINNQAFSKDLLRIITNDKNSLDDDIYQLSKFALISNIDINETNSIFEMHDVIAQKIAEINGDKNNKAYLEDIVIKLVHSIPQELVNSYMLFSKKTVRDNLEIITENAQKYNINTYKLLDLNLQLLMQYVNHLDFYNAKKLVNWFNRNDPEKKFTSWIINNNEKYLYAAYLQVIGWYYGNLTQYNTALNYYRRAEKILFSLDGYNDFKFNLISHIAESEAYLGNTKGAEESLKRIEDLLQAINEPDLNKRHYIYAITYYAESILLLTQGKYDKALKVINKSLESFIKGGLNQNDFALVDHYMIKVSIFNTLGKYQKAYSQIQKLYDISGHLKKEEHVVFGKIFTQISILELGLGNANKALEYAKKAKMIFINDPTRLNNSKEIVLSPDIYLAKAFVAEANALASLGQNEQAVKSYADAESLYWNNYQENMGNVDEISIMYLNAAKASCHLTEKAWYIKFHDQHVKKFGSTHPRSIEILKMDSICYPASQR
ncbi:tetratricopeptide repeat protein [Rickettsia endosymbiont of Culicoides newsteadi]|uniref:tetratricopeptide repeat protein n=1 Tax=Rickettsia endosymbiont of Culicoides newsteadi TaxID=1961830 RepID=UPI000BCC74C4|nr:tetratricopeptide repeat protein [Rickettsia endosymbiont of Culicoides newsteadi]OZG31476.1 hypothetical protein RiCNE_11330 [Rickettsia endosymbiont of Culicoides newsteadi]